MTTIDAHHRLRALLTRAEALLERGEPGWRELLDDARAMADAFDADPAADPSVRDDARMRLGLFDGHVAMLAGDGRGALAHLDSALDHFERHRIRSGLPRESFGDVEFSLRSARLAVLHHLDERDAVDSEHAELLAIAGHTTDPEDREIHLLFITGDLARDRNDPHTAVAAYRQAVRAARKRRDLLGPALVSLAGAEAAVGDATAAERTVARAAALVADQPDQMARLQEAKLTIAALRDDAGALSAAADDYLELATEHADAIHRSMLTEAATGTGLAAQRRGDHAGAAAHYLELADRAATRTHRAQLLARAAEAIHDGAAATADAAARARALSLLDDVDALVADDPSMAAGLTVLRAVLATRWPYTTHDDYRELLPHVQAAAIAMRHTALAAETPRARRAHAAAHATTAIELACHIAFITGRADQVAAMVDFAAATPALRAVGPSLLVGPPPPTPGLDDAHHIASRRFGVRERAIGQQ
ncbi:hypothetical protein [Corynebacterium freneyi]|uniref:Tetratricopeptide repeat protein n=1 Tax=Corynebacterium freneyi TaxID=134034 RepID=A0ABS4U7M5_9CORY|nr:hypothetical protein [Corynebacterium freneyi]MBP2332183.1 hypothetical protein [Corynebacterium freneyi]QXA53600.1 hypothetical protein I6L56_04320 [Corynebacterium freneyi]WJZ05706.1 hypothetical protein CFREN_08725 [Corynebacterium freneyi]